MRVLHSLNLFFRSCLFSLFMIVTTILYGTCCLLAAPFPLHYRYAIAIRWTQVIIGALKFLCYIDYKIEGLENIPQNRAGVVLSKHQSAWETFMLPQLFHEPAIIVKKELLWVPFFGWGLALVKPIAINRRLRSTAMEQVITQGAAVLKAGRWILVFPEGTRIPPGVVGNYRLGGARLAVQIGAPVVPVAHNAGYFWPKRGFIKKPGTIHMVIGPVIETQGRTPEEVMAEAKEWIESTISKMDTAV